MSSILVHVFTTLLVFLLSVFPFTLHFFFLISMLPLFFLFLLPLFFLTLSYLFLSVISCACPPFSSLCTANALLYCLLWWVLLFYPSTNFVRVWVSFPDYSLVCQLPSHHHLPGWRCHVPFPDKRVLFCYLILCGISIWIRVGHSLLLTPMACT